MLVLIWRYQVPAGNREAFIDAYGSSGVWARFFAQGEGYICTDLFQDPVDATSFMTLDFWDSRPAFSTFQRRHRAAYREIDARTEALTESEMFVGGFETASSADAAGLYEPGADGQGGIP